MQDRLKFIFRCYINNFTEVSEDKLKTVLNIRSMSINLSFHGVLMFLAETLENHLRAVIRNSILRISSIALTNHDK